MPSEESTVGVYRLLIRVVLPAGTGIIALAQAPGAYPAVTWGLIALAVLTLFLAFRGTIEIADDQLNNSGEWNVE